MLSEKWIALLEIPNHDRTLLERIIRKIVEDVKRTPKNESEGKKSLLLYSSRI